MTQLEKFPDIRVLFLFGDMAPNEKDREETQESLVKEHEEHCDFVQFDFIDHYMNITLDSLHALKFTLGFKWMKSKPDFFIIADDDTYIHLPELHAFLKSNTLNVTKVMKCMMSWHHRFEEELF